MCYGTARCLEHGYGRLRASGLTGREFARPLSTILATLILPPLVVTLLPALSRAIAVLAWLCWVFRAQPVTMASAAVPTL